jgi:hypothetical protein
VRSLSPRGCRRVKPLPCVTVLEPRRGVRSASALTLYIDGIVSHHSGLVRGHRASAPIHSVTQPDAKCLFTQPGPSGHGGCRHSTCALTPVNHFCRHMYTGRACTTPPTPSTPGWRCALPAPTAPPCQTYQMHPSNIPLRRSPCARAPMKVRNALGKPPTNRQHTPPSVQGGGGRRAVP